MEEKINQQNPWDRYRLNSEKLKFFFITHLDRIYAAKKHLVAKLPLLAAEAQFTDLEKAIQDTVQNIEKQIARMQMIYTLLDAEVADGSIRGLIGMIDDAFEAIKNQNGEPALQDLSIIFYLQNIESVEMASFQILRMTAVQLKNKQVSILLDENYEEARSDRTLLLMLSSKYFKN